LRDLESFLCQWDEEFRFKFYAGESGEEDKVTNDFEDQYPPSV
jgi:hypothetical protein